MLFARIPASPRQVGSALAPWIMAMVAAATREAAAAEAGAILTKTSCEAVSNLDLTPLDTRIEAVAKTTRNGHAFCDVRGDISPVTRFEALLPEESWRGD